MGPGIKSASETKVKRFFVKNLFEATASWSADLPRLFGAASDWSVLLHRLLRHPEHRIPVGQHFFVKVEPADFSWPLWALDGGGVARGVGFTLLLHFRSAFHHACMHCAQMWELKHSTWTLCSSCFVQHSDSYSVLKRYLFKITWVVSPLTCRLTPHEGRSLLQVAHGKFSPEMDLGMSTKKSCYRFVEGDLLVLNETVLPEVFFALLLLLRLILGDKSLMTPGNWPRRTLSCRQKTKRLLNAH